MLSKKNKLSIIVPAYNNEKYIIDCLNSIRNQNLECYECIIIDDGSIDNTGALCDDYARFDPHFTVFHQKNSGVSEARNKGLDFASGNYITFVDSDDLIKPETYKKALNTIQEENCDVYCFGIAKYSTKDISLYEFKRTDIQQMFIRYRVYMNSVCNKIFSMNLLRKNSICFETQIKTSEDLLVSIKALSLAHKVIYTNEPGYLYRNNEDSVTHRYVDLTTKRYRSDENMAIVNNLQEFSKKNNINVKQIINYLLLQDALSYIYCYSSFSLKDYKRYSPGIRIFPFKYSKKFFFISFLMSFHLYFGVYLFHFLQGLKYKMLPEMK